MLTELNQMVKLFTAEELRINASELQALNEKKFNSAELDSISQQAHRLFNNMEFQRRMRAQNVNSKDSISLCTEMVIATEYTTPVYNAICQKYREILENNNTLNEAAQKDPLFQQFVEGASKRCELNCIAPLISRLSAQAQPAINAYFEEQNKLCSIQ